jgi:hypothetical protein
MEQLQNKRGIYFTLPSNKASAYIYKQNWIIISQKSGKVSNLTDE